MSDVQLLPIAIGRHVNLKELQKINNGREVPMFGEYEDPEKVGTKIIQGTYMEQPELGPVHTTPKKFENGSFAPKTHQMLSVHSTREEFKNATIYNRSFRICV